MPTIRVDDEVLAALKQIAVANEQPFTNPNNVLRFKLGIDTELSTVRARRRKPQNG